MLQLLISPKLWETVYWFAIYWTSYVPGAWIPKISVRVRRCHRLVHSMTGISSWSAVLPLSHSVSWLPLIRITRHTTFAYIACIILCRFILVVQLLKICWERTVAKTGCCWQFDWVLGIQYVTVLITVHDYFLDAMFIFCYVRSEHLWVFLIMSCQSHIVT